VPLISGSSRQTTYPEGYTFAANESTELDVYDVSPHYFATMGIPILHGRDFSERDTPNSPPVAVVNQAFADKYWPDQNPIGKKISLLTPGQPPPQGVNAQPIEVVAVTKTGKYRALAEPPRPVYFLPVSQSYSGTLTLHVRSAGNPLDLAPAIRREVRALDPNLPVFSLRTVTEALGPAYARPRTSATLFALFGGVALLLAAVGFYGVMAYSVAQRTREIGVRIALGAQRNSVLNLILRRGLALTAAGMTLGLLAAFFATRFIAKLLFGVSRTDLLTFVVVPLVLFAAALLACWLPARRATRIDPISALRYE
jgi:predicted permease